MTVLALLCLVAVAEILDLAPVGGAALNGGPVPTTSEINLLPQGVTANSLAPQIVKFSVSNNRWYVIGSESNSLSVIYGDTSEIVNIALESNFGTTQRWMEVDSTRNRVYVVSQRSSIPIRKLYAIDTTTNLVVGNVALDRAPAEVGVNPYTGKVYVLNYEDLGVTIYNPDLTFDRFVYLGGAPVQFGVNPTPAVNKVFVLTLSKLVVIDATTDEILTSITWPGYAGVSHRSHNMEVNARTNKIYVVERYASGDNSRFSEIDGDTYSYRQMELIGAVEPFNVRVDEVRNKVYAANDNSANVTDIDPVAWTSRNILVGGKPNALVVDPEDGYVYSHRWTSQTMVYFDPAQVSPTVFTVANVPNFGHMVEGMAVNPNIGRVMVASGLYGGASVFKFDTRKKVSLGRIRIGNAPMDSLAVNPADGSAYVPTYEDFAVRIGNDNTATNITTPWVPRWAQAYPARDQIQIGFGAYNVFQGLRVVNGADPSRTIATVSPTYVAPRGMAIMTSTGRTYMTHADQNQARFSVIGVASGSSNYTTLYDIQISPTQNFAAEDLLADNAQNKVYGRSAGGKIGIINGNPTPPTYRETAVGVDLRDLALDPGASKLYAVDFGGNALYVFDGASERVESKTTVGNGPNRVALDPVDKRAFVTNYNSNTLTVLDISVSPPTVLRTIDLPAGTKPSAIAAGAARGTVCVSSYDSATAYLYSISEDTWGIDTLLSRPYPYGVLAGSEVFSGGDGGNSVSLSTIAIGQNSKVFVSDYLAGKIWALDVLPRRTYLPAVFRGLASGW